MGKSAKKSATKVESAPAVVAPTKATKKDKRHAEIVEEEAMSRKKQKLVRGDLKPKTEKKKKNTKTQKMSDSDEEPKKEDTKNSGVVEMVDAPSAKKAAQTPVAPQVDGLKTLFVENLNFKIEEAELIHFLKPAGKVVKVSFGMKGKKFQGHAEVEFSTPAEAREALKLNGALLLGRPVRIRYPKGSIIPWSDESSLKLRRYRVFVKGFGHDGDSNEVEELLKKCFSKCGGIASLFIYEDRPGFPTGVVHIDFNDSLALHKALGLSGTVLGGGIITVEQAKP